MAFVINPDRIGFADVFADVTQGERPIQLFRSLHEARARLDRPRRAVRASGQLSGRWPRAALSARRGAGALRATMAAPKGGERRVWRLGGGAAR